MKKTYSRPEIEVMTYDVENVVTVNVSSVFNNGDPTATVDYVKTIDYTDIFGA